MSEVRTLTARGAARRTALLDAAIAVVAEGGSGSLTHRNVAATAKASLASVTYHFSSIEELRRAMFERALQIVSDQLTEPPPTVTAEELPGLVADYVVSLVTEHRDAAAAVQEMVVAATHDPALRPTFHEYHARIAEMMAPCVGGVTAGFAMAAVLQGQVLTALTYPDLDIDCFHASVLDLIRRLGAHPAA
ncbi:DNA-binding transcriptional regulator YbjK [Streptomyces sp. B3I7]|uniref:TetR/AcrR family transcriptional regulator n=1 Tax=Streptomyces sp. B3I7 TaxID=3042269 RepID=UPI002786C460|nr:TetR family transcriptional regulator [Streptomyces sp. B3I7]MDQ0815326.1 DNA-binding transcriptional regulator YbjK [Streptomyces sp. B3I7]